MKKNDFDGLLLAVKNRVPHETIIQGHRVRLVQNWLSDRGLSMIYLDDKQHWDHSALPTSMRKIITEWKDGKRHIETFDDGMVLLMKKY